MGSFDSFKVTRVTSLAQSIDAAGIYDLRTILPDHSLLTWKINLNFSYSEAEQVRANIQRTRKIKHNTQNLPRDWLNSDCVISEIDRVIRNLEESDYTQDNIDHMYENFVAVVKTEMSQRLPSQIVLIDGLSNKHRRCKKPWWNDDLTSLWNEVCSAEKIWIKCQNSHLKKELRHIYV